MFPPVKEQLELLTRGCVDIVTREELKEKLEHSYTTQTPLRVKAGFDPTAPDLHLGHTVLLRKMRHFQQLGHTVIFLIGDFTGLIGDPTGRSVLRKPLTKEQIVKNAQTYMDQVKYILDPEKTVVEYNSTWLSQLTSEDFIRLSARFTVSRLIEREDFKNRLTKGTPLFIHELLYPILQAYDSVALQADVELGGHDQLLNLLLGRDLQKAYGQSPQIAMTVPLLEGIDGVEKMSKSLGNYIGVTEPPDIMFGKVMSISDELMWKYYELLTDVPLDEIERMKEQTRQGTLNPRDCKLDLATHIVEDFHGHEKAQWAREKFLKVFSQKTIPDDIPESSRPPSSEPVELISLIVEEGLARSRSEAKRFIEQGAVSFASVSPDMSLTQFSALKKATNIRTTLDLSYPQKIYLRVGKRKFKVIKISA